MDRRGTILLIELVRRAQNHTIMNKWLKNFFQYLDRYYVKYHSLPPLQVAGLRYFKSLVFDIVKNDVCVSILELIKEERDGGLVERDLIKSCVEIFENMGMGSLEAYTKDFEEAFLQDTRVYFMKKADEWISKDSSPEYLIKAERAISDEIQRVTSYLHPDTQMKLVKVVEDVVLQRKETELLEKEGSGLKILLMNDKAEDLNRFYKLFVNIEGGLLPIADVVRQHISDLGNEKVQGRIARLEIEPDKAADLADDPEFVKDLLALHDKYIAVVNQQFGGNTLFQKALKDAFVEIVNRDVGKIKIADLMSYFCDRILKTGSTEKLSDVEIEEYLEKTVQMFSYLTDKDLFADTYRNQLAKRLLNQRSASDDMERLMIGKLKLRCGAQFTTKMEGMINDLSLGAEHNKTFTEHYQNNDFGLGKIEFSVQVLTTGHWPSYKMLDLTLPPLMSKCVEVFKAFHDTKTSHRRLQWVYSLGGATVKGKFGKNSYDLQVTTVQAVVLLSFNESPRRTFKELQEQLSMPEDVLKKILHSLSCTKYKVINAVSSSGEVEKDKKKIEPTDTFQFNERFSSQMRKIRIPMASLEEASGTKRVDEDRSIAIEAAIVRIMKARKTLAHQQLVGEVLTQLAFFKPDPKHIKKRIEALIDRDYLERDTNNSNTYKYLA